MPAKHIKLMSGYTDDAAKRYVKHKVAALCKPCPCISLLKHIFQDGASKRKAKCKGIHIEAFIPVLCKTKAMAVAVAMLSSLHQIVHH
jgi:hypothetical protein